MTPIPTRIGEQIEAVRQAETILSLAVQRAAAVLRDSGMEVRAYGLCTSPKPDQVEIEARVVAAAKP